jgi:hypothetical protein
LNGDERVEFQKLTGREREPGHFCRELIVIAGRMRDSAVLGGMIFNRTADSIELF